MSAKKNENESSHIKKYRKKLEDTMNKEKKQFSAEAITKTKSSMHKWIRNHSKERINLKTRVIDLFDEKKHPAEPKKSILKLALKLKSTTF